MNKYIEFYESLENIFFEIYKNPKENVQCPALLNEIEYLENKLNSKFPLAYKTWLLKFGHNKMYSDGLYTLKGAENAFKEAEICHLKKEIHQYFPNLDYSYICIDYILGSDAFSLLSLNSENPNVYAYLGFDALYPLSTFTDNIRTSLLSVLIYLKGQSDKIIKRFPFLDIYDSLNSSYTERNKFLSTFPTIDSNGHILEFEEVEIAFRDYYLRVKDSPL